MTRAVILRAVAGAVIAALAAGGVLWLLGAEMSPAVVGGVAGAVGAVVGSQAARRKA